MWGKRTNHAALAIALVAIALAAAADVPGDSTPPRSPAVEQAGYLGHLSTDKPIYRIGERVYLRCVVLGSVDHAPLPNDVRKPYPALAMLRITGPKGDVIGQSAARIEQSVAAFAWNVPSSVAGGTYTASVTFPYAGYPSAERHFDVRAYRTPRLKGEIVFLRDGYGPGDTVKASLHVERAEGGIPTGATVAADAVVDGQNAFQGTTTVDASGNCSIQFALPASIARGDGTLSMAVTDGGVVEPIAKTIPILVNTVDLAFYPEGGDLVAGLPGRVYVEARTPAQKPADVVGVIEDSHGNVVANLRTEHEGRGRFAFTPAAGETYTLKLSQPAGIAKTFPLPMVKTLGASLTADSDITDALDPVRLHAAANVAGKYTVVLSKRQTEIASTIVTIAAPAANAPAANAPAANAPAANAPAANAPATASPAAGVADSQAVLFTPPSWADGVLVATVIGPDGTPLAERLLFRKSAHPLHVAITPDKSSYMPGDAVALTITTTDDNGKPVSGVVGVTATDQSVLRMVEQRDRAPHLCEMALLEDDVRDLADAQVYFDPNNADAARDTDLLLGTQGWRRFAVVDKQKFLSENGEEGRRALGDMQPVELQDLSGAEDVWGVNRAVAARGMDMAPEAFQMQKAAVRDGPTGSDMLPNDGDDDAATQPAPMVAMPMVPMNDRQVPAMPLSQIQVIREFAHGLRPDRNPGDRTDFAETLYWSAGVKTDSSGVAHVSFHLSDAVSSFEISADAFDSAGNLGETTATVASI